MIASAEHLRQLTHYEHPEDVVPSSYYGRNIRNIDWARREASRLRSSGRDARVKMDKHGKIAVFIN